MRRVNVTPRVAHHDGRTARHRDQAKKNISVEDKDQTGYLIK